MCIRDRPKKEKQEEPAEEKPKKPNIFKTFYANQGMDLSLIPISDSICLYSVRTDCSDSYLISPQANPRSEPVSYTHLDVYKRQTQSFYKISEEIYKQAAAAQQAAGGAQQNPGACLLYTSRCV